MVSLDKWACLSEISRGTTSYGIRDNTLYTNILNTFIISMAKRSKNVQITILMI